MYLRHLLPMENIGSYYDTLAPDYDRSRFANSYGKFVDAQERGCLRRMLAGTSPAHTLDLACGTGRLLEFADTGLDQSPRMLHEARQKHPGKNLVIGDATRMPFPEDSFDAIFSFHFLMHLDRGAIQAVLAEARRVLRPGGRLIVDFPSRKRRALTRGHHNRNWHGSNASDVSDWQAMTAGAWKIIDFQGIAFFPLHRIPDFFRPAMLPLDTRFCRSALRSYASYLVLCLEKK
jgi:SAM-dependent methyltransferase